MKTKYLVVAWLGILALLCTTFCPPWHHSPYGRVRLCMSASLFDPPPAAKGIALSVLFVEWVAIAGVTLAVAVFLKFCEQMNDEPTAPTDHDNSGAGGSENARR